MSSDVLAFVGVTIAALIAAAVGRRSAAAQEVTSLGGRLDKMQERLDGLETRERKLVEYAYTLRRILQQEGIETPEPPNGLDL